MRTLLSPSLNRQEAETLQSDKNDACVADRGQKQSSSKFRCNGKSAIVRCKWLQVRPCRPDNDIANYFLYEVADNPENPMPSLWMDQCTCMNVFRICTM